MRVPLTLTIIPGLILNAGGINFAIPRSAVIEILHDNNPTVSVSRLGGGLTATIRDTRYSMIDLEDVIGMPMIERQGARSLMLVRSTGGKDVPVRAETICVHSDTPGAAAIAKAVHEAVQPYF